MTKKVTLSVPDELSEKMEKWKDAFNYSGIFQEAVSDAIKRKEDFQKRLKEEPKMKQIIERLKKEKEESEMDLLNTAKEMGLEWAKLSHYDELKYVMNSPWDSGARTLQLTMMDRDSDNPEWFREQMQEYKFTDEDIDEDFWEAFGEGVAEFWDEVEDKL